ncbi:Myb/SANT-like domain containing protein [Trema orientale]|uniref:Myb/SANT-like domain containing protein n=1 Tax=Trema orientale TaxID=63057 RepID=A0A2P5BNG9_TREOI|nr:Myb/SANT-like domain containing protein [Trema orientale]
MEVGGNSQNIERLKRASRRIWTKKEEDAFVTILEDLVTKGYRCDNGSFKPGTNLIIEKALTNIFPTCGIKANPHIDSKMKVLRKQYSIVYDMLSKSGFGWNDVKKCVEVDSEEVWQSYVQHHKEAEGWKRRPFPLYEKLMNIYGTDRANGQGAETPVDMVEDINRNHVIDDMGDEEESLNQTSSTNSTASSRRKRKKPSDNISEGLRKLAESFDKMMEKSNEQVEKTVEVIVESARKKEHDQHNFMWEELTRLEIPVEVCIDALDIIVAKPWTISIFNSLSDEKKVEFVMSLLRKK